MNVSTAHTCFLCFVNKVWILGYLPEAQFYFLFTLPYLNWPDVNVLKISHSYIALSVISMQLVQTIQIICFIVQMNNVSFITWLYANLHHKTTKKSPDMDF